MILQQNTLATVVEHAFLAQVVEHPTSDREVLGST